MQNKKLSMAVCEKVVKKFRPMSQKLSKIGKNPTTFRGVVVNLILKVSMGALMLFSFLSCSEILTCCDPGGGGPKDPQLSKLPNALEWVFKSV